MWKRRRSSPRSRNDFEDIFPRQALHLSCFQWPLCFGFNQFVMTAPIRQIKTTTLAFASDLLWYDGSMDDGALRMMSGQAEKSYMFSSMMPSSDGNQAYLKIRASFGKTPSHSLPSTRRSKRESVCGNAGTQSKRQALPDGKLRKQRSVKTAMLSREARKSAAGSMKRLAVWWDGHKLSTLTPPMGGRRSQDAPSEQPAFS